MLRHSASARRNSHTDCISLKGLVGLPSGRRSESSPLYWTPPRTRGWITTPPPPPPLTRTSLLFWYIGISRADGGKYWSFTGFHAQRAALSTLRECGGGSGGAQRSPLMKPRGAVCKLNYLFSNFQSVLWRCLKHSDSVSGNTRFFSSMTRVFVFLFWQKNNN